MSKTRYPPLRITEEKMSNKEILETFNTAFGGEAVAKVTKSKNTRIIHIDQENEARQSEWKDFYAALDEQGSVWIKAEYFGDGVYFDSCFDYSLCAQIDHWEVRYARRTAGIPAPVQPKPKVCTCGCTCGARMGISI